MADGVTPGSDAARAAALQEPINRIEAEFARLRQEAESTPGPLWVRMLFRRSGKPRKLLRRAFFHKSGKPRDIFRSLVLHPDGRPHRPFRQWMSSLEYEILRGAVRVPDVRLTGPVSLSPDAGRIARRIAALRASSDKD